MYRAEIATVTERHPCCGAAKTWSDPAMNALCDFHRLDCPKLLEYPLHELSPVPTCPKCGSTTIATVFHEAHWYVTAHPTDPWRHDLLRWSCLIGYFFRPVEHLDRMCSVCAFKWLEKTAAVGEPAPDTEVRLT